MDLQNPESKWSYHRMSCTDNFAIFWEKGFGNDLSNPPQLEGHSMSVNLSNLEKKLESFYTYFYQTLQFAKAGSKSSIGISHGYGRRRARMPINISANWRLLLMAGIGCHRRTARRIMDSMPSLYPSPSRERW